MRFRPEWAFLIAAGGMFQPLFSQPPLFAQSTVSVPFVGCASSGQTETLEAPKGTSRSALISAKDAQSLAYYESSDGIGVLAPRGWYCEGASGSDGFVLFLTPKPTDRSPPEWRGFYGPAIEVHHFFSGTSGRFDVARTFARVFPAYRGWAKGVLEGIGLPVASGPYSTDALAYRSKSVVEFKTPAQTEGLGTQSTWLKKNDLPIAGAAILIEDSPGIGDAPDVLLLAVRLPHDLARLTPIIVRHVEPAATK
jgi:hypothetical protein